MQAKFSTYGKLLAALLLVAGWLAAPLKARAWQDGSPILVVESYSTNPSPTVSGETFTLNVVVRNTGTQHADDVSVSVAGGGSLVGVGAPAAVGKVDPQTSVPFSLQVQVPEDLTDGAYSLSLSFLYRIGDSGAYEVVRTIGIQVKDKGTGVVGEPQIVVESVNVAALPKTVGETFDVALTLKNVGARKAIGVKVTLKINEYLSPAKGSGTTSVGDIVIDKTATFNVALVLDKVNPAGRILQTISLEFYDADGKRYSQEETVSIEVNASARQTPQLIVADYQTAPERPVPGEPFTLTLNVANVGGGEARRTLLRLGGETGMEPFAPVGTSNVSFVATIPADGMAVVTQCLVADGSAVGGVYRLNVALTYESAMGEAQTENEVISLLVAVPPQLRVGLFEPLAEPLTAGAEFDIPVEVINIGRQTLNVSTVEVTSEGLTLTEASLYVGPLDAGTSSSLTPKAVAAMAGEVTATVAVHYLDDFNQEHVFTYPLHFTVEAASAEAAAAAEGAKPAASADASDNKIWQAILGFFGLAG